MPWREGLTKETVLNLAWESGVHDFFELTHDGRKRLFVENHTKTQPHCALKLLVQDTKTLHKAKYLDRSSLSTAVERVLQTIDSHAVAGDVFVQNQGQPATFAWGSIRLVLRLVTADLEANQTLAGCFIDVAEQLETAETRLSVFPSDHALFEAVKHLFAYALWFLVKTNLFLSKSKPARAVNAASGGNVKFKRLFEDMQRRSASIERAFSTATDKRSRTHAQLNKVLEWFDKWLPGPRVPLVIPEAIPGTCEWIWDEAEFQGWTASGHVDPLLIKGLPGCGKTVLARHLADHPHFTAKNSSATVFYHCNTATNSAGFLATILASLVRRIITPLTDEQWHEGVLAAVQDLIAPAVAEEVPRASLLQQTAHRIFSGQNVPEVFVIVDALSDLHSHEERAFFICVEALAAQPGVCLLAFTHPNDERLKTRRKVRMAGSKVDSTINHYMNWRVNQCDALKSLLPSELERIRKSSHGMVLLCRLLLDDLEHAESIDHRREILVTTPTELSERYETEWRRLVALPSKTSQCTPWQMFALIVPARRPLTAHEISSLISIDSISQKFQPGRALSCPPKIVARVCGSFVELAGVHVQIAHPSMAAFLKQKLTKAPDSPYKNLDAHMAEKCLAVLNEEKYAQKGFASALLRKHLLPSGLMNSTSTSLDVGQNDEMVSYEYAALEYQNHLITVSNPSDSLLDQVATFIIGFQAVTYSERLLDIKGGNEAASLNAQISVRAQLMEWNETLSPSSQKRARIPEFFTTAHKTLRHELVQDAENDRLLPLTPAIRLGQWYSSAASSNSDTQNSYKYKKLVYEEAAGILGKRNPTTLRWRISWLSVFPPQGLYLEAEIELKEIVDIERDVLPDSEEFFKAVQLLGDTQYHLTKLQEAERSLEESGLGLLQTAGQSQWIYQVNKLYLGWVIERQGDLERAADINQAIIASWGPIGGATNGLTLFAHTSLGSVQRKQQNYQQATENLRFAYDARKRLFTINSNTSVDSGIQLALALRDVGLGSHALELLDFIETSTVFPASFERVCQVTHIRALVGYDQHGFKEPNHALMRIVDATTGDNRESNNRDALWIRTTLAAALRSRQDEPHDGTLSDALMLFAEIVRPRSTAPNPRPWSPASLADEPEGRHQLEIAEKAVILVKNRDQDGAERLLRENGLEWVRQKDFWIGQGGPLTDLAWLKQPVFTPSG